MKDIRPMAEERARQRIEEAQGPPDSGFMSERARAKEARKQEVTALTGDGVHKIAAASAAQQDDRILRVAAYCRVSTDDIDQALSIELQKANYRDMIRANPKWKYVGTYVDDGFSGTNTDHRPAFQLMMKDAMAGKIDMIVTKSVSRFARNLLDCIGWVRELKDRHDPPIAVFFEQEHLNTLDATSNIILFVLAMVAEEESHMKSEAMLLSLEWRFSRGRFLTPSLLGYDKLEVPDGHGGHRKELVINEDEARTVRLMYYMLLNGSSTSEIAETLTDLGRETGLKKVCGKTSTHWTPNGVAAVMRNERHCGDVLARKTWTPDFHDHKSKRNNGKKNKYYQPGHHEGIVTRAQWNAAQRILNSNRYRRSGGYLPMRVIDHGALCGFISINKAWAGFGAAEYFRVSRIALGLADGELETDLEKEHLPDRGYPISGIADDNGVQRIARSLTMEEAAVKAQLEGMAPDVNDVSQMPTVSYGFQVVNGSLFSQANEAVITIRSSTVRFSPACISRLKIVATDKSGAVRIVPEWVEILLNPVERVLAVRPSTHDNPNAVRWVTQDGRCTSISAKAFCSILYEILGWDSGYAYRVPVSVRSRNGQTILFFDLDNYVGREIGKKDVSVQPMDSAPEARHETDETEGIFFGADDEEIHVEESPEQQAQWLKVMEEYEKRSFGTPFFEHNSGFRISSMDQNDDWDVMAPARAIGSNHRVGQDEIEALQDEMMSDLANSDTEEGGETR